MNAVVAAMAVSRGRAPIVIGERRFRSDLPETVKFKPLIGTMTLASAQPPIDRSGIERIFATAWRNHLTR